MHIDIVFCAYHGFDNKPKVLGDRVSQGLSHDLTGILHSKLDFQILVPIGVYLQLPFPDPFGVVFDDAFDFKVMLNVEFCQSDPDCEKFVPSLGIKPDFAAQIIHRLGLDPDNMLPSIKILAKQAVVLSRPTFRSVGPVGTNFM